jgi:riboflavin synthase
MFTGIVKYVGEVVELKKVQNCTRLVVKCDQLLDYEIGGSIAVNGVCLSLVSIDSGFLEFDVIEETLNRSNLEYLEVSDELNLEPSLKLQDGLDGHLVTGHIDFTSELVKIEENEYFFSIDMNYKKYFVTKGSVCINGVSLTVSGVYENMFKVSLIPLTLEQTNLKNLKVKSKVNIEVDLIARYIEGLKQNYV